jgi:aspartyl-tRNA(Asn)/glutamyl-tRNA(Gln) amidotransferase subunit A
MALSWTLDKLGPLCLTADDCGLVLEAIAGPDPNDQTAADMEYTYDGDSNFPYKLAILKGALEGCGEAVKENFENALRVLEGFATIEEIEFPDLPYEAVTRTILNAEAASAFDEFTENGTARELTAPECHYGPYARTAVLAKDYLKALRLRGVICRVVDEAMAPFDAVVAPSRRSPASPIDQEFRKTVPGTARDTMGAVGNGAGLPSISVPNGFTPGGLPTGIQFMGRPYEENVIIAVAMVYQSKTDWHLRHPEPLIPET